MKYLICADCGRFPSVEKAAFAEKEIDWLSADPSDADACTESFAAYDIYISFIKYKKASVALADARTAVPSGDTVTVFVGSGDTAGLSDDGYRIASADGGRTVHISGKNRVAVLYGAYAFEELCGIRFLTPEKTVYSRRYDRLPCGDFSLTSAPSFRTRGAYGEMIEDTGTDFVLWLSHARLNYVSLHTVTDIPRLKKLGLGIAAGRHPTAYLFMDPSHPYPYSHPLCPDGHKPADPYPVSPLCRAPKDGKMTYGDAHPEWFAEVEGKRRLFRDYALFEKGYPTGDYICTSSADGLTEYTRLIVDALADGAWKYADFVDLWGLDNGTWCDCEECRRTPVLSTRQLTVAYRLSLAIKQAQREGRIRRPVRIIVPAYHETLQAPDRPLPEDFDYDMISVIFFVIERCYLHDIDDPVCTETNADLIRLLKTWTDGYYKGQLYIGEYYNVSAFSAMPFVLKDRILHDIPYYYSIGARHFHYMHMTSGQWGVSAITNFLYSCLLWDITADADALLDEYFFLRYGGDAAEMRRLYEKAEKITANCKLIKHYQYIHGVRTTLFGYLNSGRPGFPDSLHLRLDSRADDPQAGPSLIETAESFNALFDEYKLLFGKKRGLFFRQDYAQLEYGALSLSFTAKMMQYNTLRESEPEKAAAVLTEIRRLGEKLRRITKPLSGYDTDDANRYENGLTASFMKPFYDKWTS